MKLKGGEMAKYVTVGHVVHCKHETCLRENTTQNHKTSSSVSHYCLFDSVDIYNMLIGTIQRKCIFLLENSSKQLE